MFEALDDRRRTAYYQADNIAVNAEKKEDDVLADHFDTNKIQNGDWSQEDESDDKQPKRLPKWFQDKMGQVMRKRVLCHMQTTKAQISAQYDQHLCCSLLR